MRHVPADAAAADKIFATLVDAFSDNVFNFTHLAMTLWATPAAFPNLKLTDVFTDEAAKTVDDIMRGKCVHAAADTISFSFGNAYKSLLKEKPSNSLDWIKAFIDGSVPPMKPVAPVIIFWGTKDTVVPPIMSKIYRDQMCGLGGDVHE